MAKKPEPGNHRSGPRAPVGKKPLTAVIDNEVIKDRGSLAGHEPVAGDAGATAGLNGTYS